MRQFPAMKPVRQDMGVQVLYTGVSGEVSSKRRAPTTPQVAENRWANFSGGPRATVQGVEGFWAQEPALGHGTVKPDWRGPGDPVKFFMKVAMTGDPNAVEASIITNANHPEAPHTQESWEQTYPMKFSHWEKGKAVFEGEVPIHLIGTYQAKGRIRTSKDGPWTHSPGGNLEFRPMDVRIHGITWEIVCMKNLASKDGKPGTFRDLMDPASPYSIEKSLADNGVTGLRLQPCFEHFDWSPYTANHSLAPSMRYSRDAEPYLKQLEELRASGMDQNSPEFRRRESELLLKGHQAAFREMHEFIKYCKDRGVFVMLDVVPNHSDIDLRMEDAFFAPASKVMQRAKEIAGNETPSQKHIDEAFLELAPDPDLKSLIDLYKSAAADGDRIMYQVRRRDPTQTVVNQGQLDFVRNAMKDTAGISEKWIERVPHVFAKWDDPTGANNAGDAADGGFFEWPKPTANHNHGTHRWGYEWFTVRSADDKEFEQAFEPFADRSQPSPQVASELMREARQFLFLLTALEFDGLRIDHATGDPKLLEDFYGKVLALMQMVRPDVVFTSAAEDFHTGSKSERFVDFLEGGEHHSFRGATGPAQIRSAIDAGWRYKRTTLNMGNHDESRPIHRFGSAQDYAYRQAELISLGPWCNVIGDRRGELMDGAFRNSSPIPVYAGMASNTSFMVEGWITKALKAKNAVPCFQSGEPHWMNLKSGGHHGDIQAAYRFDPYGKTQGFYFGNCNGAQPQSGWFELPPSARARIDRNTKYHLVNRWGGAADRVSTKTGAELLDKGIYVGLDKHEQQALELVPEGHRPWGNEHLKPRPDEKRAKLLYTGPGGDDPVSI